MSARIYHNPRCSKSRQTLQLLEDRGEEVEVVLYLQQPPTTAELDTLCTALGRTPQKIVRSKEARFAELGLDLDDERPRQEWLQILVDNPVLIERPIVQKGDRAAMGRPPEDVLAIL